MCVTEVQGEDEVADKNPLDAFAMGQELRAVVISHAKSPEVCLASCWHLLSWCLSEWNFASSSSCVIYIMNILV